MSNRQRIYFRRRVSASAKQTPFFWGEALPPAPAPEPTFLTEAPPKTPHHMCCNCFRCLRYRLKAQKRLAAGFEVDVRHEKSGPR